MVQDINLQQKMQKQKAMDLFLILYIVTFQQVSGSSGKIETYGFDEHGKGEEYDHCAENLAKLIREYQPTAEIVLQMTWAYEIGYSPLGSNYGVNGKTSDLDAQNNMYNKIYDTVTYACERLATITTLTSG